MKLRQIRTSYIHIYTYILVNDTCNARENHIRKNYIFNLTFIKLKHSFQYFHIYILFIFTS